MHIHHTFVCACVCVCIYIYIYLSIYLSIYISVCVYVYYMYIKSNKDIYPPNIPTVDDVQSILGDKNMMSWHNCLPSSSWGNSCPSLRQACPGQPELAPEPLLACLVVKVAKISAISPRNIQSYCHFAALAAVHVGKPCYMHLACLGWNHHSCYSVSCRHGRLVVVFHTHQGIHMLKDQHLTYSAETVHQQWPSTPAGNETEWECPLCSSGPLYNSVHCGPSHVVRHTGIGWKPGGRAGSLGNKSPGDTVCNSPDVTWGFPELGVPTNHSL